MLLLPLAGCDGERTLTRPPTADPTAVAADEADRRLALHLGPRMLQVALPLMLARTTPHLPLYLRHLDGLSLHLYAVPDDTPPSTASTSSSTTATSASWLTQKAASFPSSGSRSRRTPDRAFARLHTVGPVCYIGSAFAAAPRTRLPSS